VSGTLALPVAANDVRAMTARVFNRRLYLEPLSFVIVRRVLLFFLSIHVVLATISGYRAIVQIYRLDLSASDATLRVGSTLRTYVVTSGRTYASVSIVLLQGQRAETLAVQHVPRNYNASYNPLAPKASLAIELTPAALARFDEGPALVRATATGGPQWMRTPPPTVRVMAVNIGRRI
jgi:hypothetical protein